MAADSPWSTLPIPNPKPGRLLVRIVACGICGTDLHFVRDVQTIVQINDEHGPP